MKPAWEHAVKQGDMAALRALIGSGQDVNALDRYGQTALMLAAMRGHVEVVELLIAHGADLNRTAKFTLSALMLAILNKHSEVAKRLIYAGADLSIKGSGAPGFAGKTAYDLAVAGGMQELLAELQPQLGQNSTKPG